MAKGAVVKHGDVSQRVGVEVIRAVAWMLKNFSRC